MIFSEVRNSLKIDVDVSGSKANRKYITFFALFTLIPSILIILMKLQKAILRKLEQKHNQK